MSAGNLPLDSLSGSTPIRPTIPVETELRAEVTEDLGEGRYALKVGGQRLEIASATPLTVGQNGQATLARGGQLTLTLGGPGAPPTEAALTGDTVTLAAPFRLQIALSEALGQATTLTSGQAIGVGATGEGLALQLANGTVLPGTALAESDLTALLEAGGEALPAALAKLLVAAGNPGSEGAFLPRLATLPLTTAPGAAPVALLQIPLADLAAWAEAFAQAGGGGAGATLLRESSRLLLQLGERRAAFLPLGELPAQLPPLLPAETLLLSGEIARQSTPISSDPLVRQLLHAGLSVTPASREAAEALQAAGLPLERTPLQALLTLTAGLEGVERRQTLAAGAHLLAREIPLAPALAAGIEPHLQGGAPLLTAIDSLTEKLTALLPEASVLRPALAALEAWPLPLDGEAVPGRLAAALQSFGRETLATVATAIEQATLARLAADPLLAKLDAALALLRGPGTPPVAGALPGLGTPRHPLAAAPLDSDGAQLVRLILSAKSPEEAEGLVRAAQAEHPPARLEAVTRALEQLERENLTRDPFQSRLADTAEEVRDLGRRAIALKAETLAGLRSDPAVLLGEIPLRFGDERGEGKLQVMLRRQQKRGEKRWSARVVLDLMTTKLGPIVGDMRFVERALSLRLFAASPALVAYLEAHADELIRALEERGFPVEILFQVIPKDEDPAPRADPFARREVAPAPPRRLDVEA